jgi:RNA-directed DNA polymerase
MQSPIISTKLQQIAEQAVKEPEKVFTDLMHLVDVEFLKEAYRKTRKEAAPGLDGITGQQYGEKLEANLEALYERMRKGQYRAPAVKRIWLDKENGKKRPIGIPEFEDKVVQQAVSMLLTAVYEQDFSNASYGYRPGRSPQQAIQKLWDECNRVNISWIVDVDVSGFFDSLDHEQMQGILKQRVNDGGIRRYIGKWLNAGVVEGGNLSYPKQGTPQGGVISPILANIYLHHVLDEWIEKEVQPRLKGKSFLIRFADDFVIGCEREEDAQRVMEVLPKRFGRFHLKINPDKTRLVPFRRPNRQQKRGKGEGTFDFLGFTHYWARSRNGGWVIKRKTAQKRLRRSMKAIWEWCRENRHQPVQEQFKMLSLKLNGHYQYYGIRSNYQRLYKVYRWTYRAWRYWLGKRCSKGKISWEKFKLFEQAYPLPKPRIVHSI